MSEPPERGSRRAAFGDRKAGKGKRWQSAPDPRLHPIPRLPAAAFAALFVLTTLPSAAADPLRMENALPVAPVRLGGPVYVAGELQSDYPGLLEGRLRFVLRDGSSILSVVETDPLALVTGVTPFRQIIPVPANDGGLLRPEATVEFLGEEARYRLGTIPIRVPNTGVWEAVVLVAEASTTSLVADGLFREELSLEKAFPEDPQAAGSTVECYLPALPANRLPEQPLAYCAFDLVALPPDAFRAMNGRQLDAIAAWVRAGGGVCVRIDGTFDAAHADFLNDLFRDREAAPFLLDDAGRFGEPDGTADGVFSRQAGLGYAVALFGAGRDSDFDTAAWRAAHARLWRLRDEYVRIRERGGFVEPPTRVSPQTTVLSFADGRPVYDSVNVFDLGTVPTPSYGTAIVNALRPDDIRLIPGWAVVMLLFGYAAVVGPLDYLLLGRLRMRKWTWLTFPAVTLAVTWGVVATADAFMSGNDHRRTVEVVDFDAKGEPVRRTRLEMLFRGSSDPVLHEPARVWFSPLDRRHFLSEENAAPTGPYAGTLPSRYAVPQQVAKWTPQVNRTFEIAPEDVPAIDWSKFEPDRDRLPVVLPDGRTAYSFRFHTLDSGTLDVPLGSVSDSLTYGFQPPYGRPQEYRQQAFLAVATAADSEKRSAIQYQRSPLGFGRLDDLPFIDASDTAADVLVVWMQETDGDLVVYRKSVRLP